MTRDVHTIIPLVDMCSQEFANQYEFGLHYSLIEERKGQPVDDKYLVENLKTLALRGYFDGQHEADLAHIGFFIGKIHGGILSPQTGELFPDVTTLVTFHEKEIRRGYRAGREFVFFEAYPEQKRFTDVTLIERLRESIIEMLTWGDSDQTWNFSIGCVLGELSCHLFPETQREREHWQRVKQRIEARLALCQEAHTSHTDPLPVLSLQEA